MTSPATRGRGHRTLVMGVLNVTPDSFSDGGDYFEPDAAIAQGLRLAAAGADIVDVGGESTRPGAEPVTGEEELRRVLPVVRALAEAGITVSIDTLHAETAQAAVSAGARYINDVSGGTFDPAMYAAAAWASAEHGAGFVVGHWRGIPDRAESRSHYADVVTEVRDALAEQARAAVAVGVDPAHIVLDPGLGFDKTAAQSWRLLAELDALTALGYPVLVGASRKRMIAESLGAPTMPEERDLASAVASAFAAEAGAWGVRVHDVAATKQALAVQRAWNAAAPDSRAQDRSTSEPDDEDRITLTGLEVFAHHGVFDFERREGQRFVIDVSVAAPLRAAADGDDLSRTVHYGELAAAVVAAAERDPVDLIETLAERVAAVALGFAGVREARVTVHKPDAPIEGEFEDVSVSIVRVPSTPAVLAFGANLGDRSGTIAAAQQEIADAPGIAGFTASRLIESVALKPEGPDADAPGYLNGVALVDTTLRPHELLALLQGIEHRHGRVRGECWGDRTLDIDIVAYGDRRIDGERLTVPHPRAHERDFVLAPWLELDPEAAIAGRGGVAELLAELRGREGGADAQG